MYLCGHKLLRETWHSLEMTWMINLIDSIKQVQDPLTLCRSHWLMRVTERTYLYWIPIKHLIESGCPFLNAFLCNAAGLQQHRNCCQRSSCFFLSQCRILLAFESNSKDGIFLLSNTIHSKSRPEFILCHEENLLIFPLSLLLEMYLFLN